jgi:hypothetical protein
MNQTALYITEAVSEYITEPERFHLSNLVSANNNVEDINRSLYALTRIRRFFSDQHAFEEFRQILNLTISCVSQTQERQWGDFQTPPRLVDQVCGYLYQQGISTRVIIEPTYGIGNFVLGALKAFPAAELLYGVEVQEKYQWNLKIALLHHALCGRQTSTARQYIYT